MFWNREKNKNTSSALANALSKNTSSNNYEYQPLRLSGSISENDRGTQSNQNNNLSGLLNSGKQAYDAYKSGAFNFGGGGGEGAGAGGGSSVPWAAIGKGAKSMYNSGFGLDDADYSDTEESVIYPLQGASVGAQFGPWGALGGALYGLGYSFKDDLGLEDNEWYTDLIFPIGMGDEHQGLIQL